jgi:hypothetical protein
MLLQLNTIKIWHQCLQKSYTIKWDLLQLSRQLTPLDSPKPILTSQESIGAKREEIKVSYLKINEIYKNQLCVKVLDKTVMIINLQHSEE